MNEGSYYFLSFVVSIVMAIISVIGLVFACIQLRQIKINRQRQFDQSRREKTIEMVTYYIEAMKPKTTTTEKIVSSLSDAQCQDLYNCQPFFVDENVRNNICSICPEKRRCEKLIVKKRPCDTNKKGEYRISGEILYSMRDTVIAYLNSLECVLLAWQLGIVDQQALEEQFIFLDKKRRTERALENFRGIAGGGRAYPAIERFYQHIKKKKRDEAEKALKDILQ